MIVVDLSSRNTHAVTGHPRAQHEKFLNAVRVSLLNLPHPYPCEYSMVALSNIQVLASGLLLPNYCTTLFVRLIVVLMTCSCAVLVAASIR